MAILLFTSDALADAHATHYNKAKPFLALPNSQELAFCLRDVKAQGITSVLIDPGRDHRECSIEDVFADIERQNQLEEG